MVPIMSHENNTELKSSFILGTVVTFSNKTFKKTFAINVILNEILKKYWSPLKYTFLSKAGLQRNVHKDSYVGMTLALHL